MNASAEQSTAVILIDHGSRRSEPGEALAALSARLAQTLHWPVYPAHMAMAEPTLAAAAETALAEGATRLVIVPLFLFAGSHATRDVPALIEDLRLSRPNVTVELRPVLAEAPGLVDLLAEIAGAPAEGRTRRDR